MKLFPLAQEAHTYSRLAAQVASLLSEVVLKLTRTPKKNQCIQLALFIFHAHAKIATYHRFDRFIYACAAILLAGKLTEQIEYPVDILKCSRSILREKRGLEGEDSEQKIKTLMKKLFEAEVNLMVSLGFDLELEIGHSYLQQWQRGINDNHFFRIAAEQLTRLYETDVVLYYEPELLALTAMSLAVKKQGLTPDICGWSSDMLAKFKNQQSMIKEVTQLYHSKVNNSF